MSSSFAEAAGLDPGQSLDENFERTFNELFAKFDQNRDRIVKDLAKLVSYVARGIAMANRQDSSDLESHVYLHALKILPRYFRKAAKKEIPPHDWVKKAINRKFWELAGRDLMVRKRSRSIDSVDEGVGAGMHVDPMAFVRSKQRQRSFRLEHPDEIQKAVRLLDWKLGRLIRAYSISRDEIEKHIYRSNVLALQDLRMELIGSFKRIMTEGVEYLRNRRHHHMEAPARRRGPIRSTKVEDRIIMEAQIPLWTLPS